MISLMKERGRSRKEFVEEIGISRTNVYYRLKILMNRGIVKLFRIPGFARTNYGIVRKYSSYSIVSSIDGVLCPDLVTGEKYLRQDLTDQYASMIPHEGLMGELLQGAKRVTLFCDRRVKYTNVTLEWLLDNFQGSERFEVIFFGEESSTDKKLEWIKKAYDGFSYVSYNMLIDKDEALVDALRYLEDPAKDGFRVKDDPVIHSYYNLLHPYDINREYDILRIVYESYIKQFIMGRTNDK